MHGYIKFESEVNQDPNSGAAIKLEEKILKSVGTIICVSKFFSEHLKQELPEYAHKIVYVNNGADLKKRSTTNTNHTNQKMLNILSFGGGLPIKNNMTVCEAIDQLALPNVNYTVVGDIGIDGSGMLKYSFVTLIENLSQDQALAYIANTDLYIQNSVFETFCLSACEAVSLSKKILLSKNIGALDSLTGLNKFNIINDPYNVHEIKRKIEGLLKADQIKSVRIKSHSDWKNASAQLLNVLLKESS
jgi:glycosyltransferase involved in cell wall biosynthesis